ncbi:MAG: hypothetical protein M5U28_51330 [Sandaracinaceae bacterium]|nr:hypothetical protein [Sandaracinaceae bacterium]
MGGGVRPLRGVHGRAAVRGRARRAAAPEGGQDARALAAREATGPPDSIIAAIDRALDPDPALRWQSADDFGTALSSGSVSIADLDWDDL